MSSADGAAHVVYAQEQATGLRLIVDGKTCLFSEEYDPTVLRVGMPGKLVRCVCVCVCQWGGVVSVSVAACAIGYHRPHVSQAILLIVPFTTHV